MCPLTRPDDPCRTLQSILYIVDEVLVPELLGTGSQPSSAPRAPSIMDLISVVSGGGGGGSKRGRGEGAGGVAEADGPFIFFPAAVWPSPSLRTPASAVSQRASTLLLT